MTHLKSPDCWICGKPVAEDQAGMDEFGVPVHSDCQDRRIGKLRSIRLGVFRQGTGHFEELPAEHREAFELAYFGGLRHTEITERTGQALGTVKSRI
jgi:hypothetical protein